MMEKSKSSRIWLLAGSLWSVFLILCLGIIWFSVGQNLFVSIEPNERGIIVEMNKPTGEILEPGFHFVLLGKRVEIFNIGRQTYTTNANSVEAPDFIQAQTKDGQAIQVEFVVVYAVDPEHIVDLYTIWQDQYPHGVVRPSSRGIARGVLGDYTYNEVLEKQTEIESVIFEPLREELAENFLLLVEFQLLDIRLATP